GGLTAATLEGQFWYLCSTKPVTRLSSSPTDLTFDQTASPGVFRLQGKRLRAAAIDLKRILLGSLENSPPSHHVTYKISHPN
ncbi:hypothetical protein, partial [Cronobacter sakazakii]|uniref:hypothetical protein n=1 Tax=Cronobacter sakazakii TaxID=28141 RepID=UPI001F232ADF